MQPLSSPPPSGEAGGSDASSALSETTSKKLGKDGFLKILVTQLKNQNPSKPMKGRNLASQLAQFSSVEQLNNISGQLKGQESSNRALTQSINSGVATDLIGRSVEASGGQFEWNGDGEATLGMELDAAASEVSVTIRDAAGNATKTQTLKDVTAGTKEITWDGKTDDGAPAPAGEYSVEVEATDAQGESVNASPYLTGTVDRIAFGKNGTKLWVGGAKIPMNRVDSVTAP